MAEVVRIAEPAEPAGTQTLPQNVEAEAALLGALMIDNRLVEDIQLKLKPHHFFEPLHGRIYEAILKMTDGNRVANPVTLKPLFESDDSIKEVGGAAYLAQLTGSGAAVIGARDFAAQIYDLALLRALIGVGRDLVEGALDTSEDVAPLAQIERAETELYKVAEEGGAEGKAKSFSEATKEALEMAERALNSGGHLSGLTTGLEALNSKIGGLHRSDLIIVAGRPGMGKSALGTNMAFAAARRFLRDTTEDGLPQDKSAGAPVAIFSLEMSSDQLATRILAEQSGITSENLRMGRISQEEFRKLARAAAELQSLPLYIDDTPGLTIAALRTRARRLKRQKGIGMVIVDYLQLLQGTGRNSNENRVQEISEISRGLKQLAKELDVPVVGLSQLSRQVEQREDKRPQLADLRESGSIEQDADIVLFIYRDEYYLKGQEVEMPTPDEAATNLDRVSKYEDWRKKFDDVAGRAEIIVAKQRHGSTGIVRVRFDGRTTKFSDVADDGYLPELRS
jgi:replicative DNA helicase